VYEILIGKPDLSHGQIVRLLKLVGFDIDSKLYRLRGLRKFSLMTLYRLVQRN
jgi:hypothetical protein